MSEPLCLLAIHAHPDDEASKGAGTVARYHDEGVRCVLVTCTGGEAGDILNPAMDTPEVRADLGAVRLAELRRSAEILGYDVVELLGYHDSGMPGSEHNRRPDNFANAPVSEVVERLVRIIRRERPQVVITYHENQRGYPHPDHLKVHEVSVPAFEAAGDPERFPDAGEPWQPLKLYYTTFSMPRIKALHETFLARGEDSPFDERWFSRPWTDDITTRIDVRRWYHRREEALRAHATQVDPESQFWFGLPTEVAAEAYPWEDFVLARSLVDTELPEDDLFAGIRRPAPAGAPR